MKFHKVFMKVFGTTLFKKEKKDLMLIFLAGKSTSAVVNIAIGPVWKYSPKIVI